MGKEKKWTNAEVQLLSMRQEMGQQKTNEQVIIKAKGAKQNRLNSRQEKLSRRKKKGRISRAQVQKPEQYLRSKMWKEVLHYGLKISRSQSQPPDQTCFHSNMNPRLLYNEMQFLNSLYFFLTFQTTKNSFVFNDQG